MAAGASLLLSSVLARKSVAEQESTMGGKTSAEWVKIAVGILFCTCLAPVRPSSTVAFGRERSLGCGWEAEGCLG